MTKNCFSVFTGIVSLSLAVAAHAQQKLVPAQSEITFVARQMGVPLDGKFGKFEAQIALDMKKPEAGKVVFTIDLGSAAVGDAETVKELKTPEWFNVGKFPVATFSSASIKQTGVGKLEVGGTLSIKGNVKPLTVPVTLIPGAGGVTLAQGSFSLKRVDFKIGEGDWADVSIVANDVFVRFKLAVTGL
ncbi:MAG: YceI family protein [Polaromonas sp.]|nr:YceI family protein [Polaromonas sp.]